MNSTVLRLSSTLVTLAVVVIAIIISPARFLAATRSVAQRFGSKAPGTVPAESHLTSLTTSNMSAIRKTPVYFLSHGGPNIMYDTSHPVYPQLQKVGREITQQVKPKAVVIFSAHWQGEPNVIEINTSPITDLIYDFYGFPSHYYKEKYPNVGSPEVAGQVLDLLKEAGIKTQELRRGLDHGVWAVFKVAFNPETNPLNVPIVQVSLFATEDPTQHYKLGQAVQKLREQNIAVIASGMAVHNLRDFRFAMAGQLMSYAKPFDEALRDAVEEKDIAVRESKLEALLERKDARGAHPTFEHLLPIHVAAGAAGSDLGKRLWTLCEGSFSWAMFRFGDV